MSQDLEAKAKVIIDLLNQGAEEVSITGTDIKAIRKPSSDNLGPNTQGTIQIVNVNAQASSQSSTSLELKLHIARVELKEKYRQDEKRLEEIDGKLNSLEKELSKPTPNQNKLKEILRWAIDFGWDVFAKLAPIIIHKLSMVA